MRLRLAKVDEFQFLTCVQHCLWGSRASRFKDWHIGDYLIIIVDKKLAGLAEVTGPQFSSNKKVWDNGLFPYRIPIRFIHIADPEDRPTILGPIRDTLTKLWGPRYGLGLLNQLVIESPHADVIVNAVLATFNSQGQFNQNIDALLEQAKLARALFNSNRLKKSRRRQNPVPAPRNVPEDKTAHSKKDESEHTSSQYELVDLGKITGCSVWLAANDQGRIYRGKSLSEGCLRKLPNLGLSEEATKRISLIDVIWIKQNAPICAFEIETSTSIYSGLLRMADLIAVVPALKMKLFIVAPKERRDRVLRELSRPTFLKIGLSEYCRYISAEDLHALLNKVRELTGYIQPSVLDSISIELDDDADFEGSE